MAHFANKNSVNESTSATVSTVDSSKLTVDTTIEVYKYGHSKKSDCRNTIFVTSDFHRDLCTLKKDLRKEYRLATDARRNQIGDFNIEIGVACSEKTYMANAQTDWENLRVASPKYQLDLEIAKKSNFFKLAQNEALRALVTKISF